MSSKEATGLTPLALVWYYASCSCLFMFALVLCSPVERGTLYIQVRYPNPYAALTLTLPEP